MTYPENFKSLRLGDLLEINLLVLGLINFHVDIACTKSRESTKDNQFIRWPRWTRKSRANRDHYIQLYSLTVGSHLATFNSLENYVSSSEITDATGLTRLEKLSRQNMPLKLFLRCFRLYEASNYAPCTRKLPVLAIGLGASLGRKNRIMCFQRSIFPSSSVVHPVPLPVHHIVHPPINLHPSNSQLTVVTKTPNNNDTALTPTTNEQTNNQTAESL